MKDEKQIKLLDLQKFHKIISNKKEDSYLKIISDFLDTEKSNEKERKLIIEKIINNVFSFDIACLKYAMKNITKEQNFHTDDSIIKKLDDLKSTQNYGDFLTFIDEDGIDYYVIGDLHDDMNSFDQILKSIDFVNKFDNIKLIFLGDYIDRGKDKLNLMNKIIYLKYLLPNNIYLLRGNHELYIKDKDGNYLSPMLNADQTSYHFNLLTFLVNSTNEKNIKMAKRNGIDKELIELYANLFDSMPTLALFNFKNIRICAMHGGLPRVDLSSQDYYSSKSFESFNTLLDENTKDSVGIKQKRNILWSDPYDGYEEAFKNSSEVRFKFSQQQFVAFCKKYNIDMVLRAHEAQNLGYKTYFDDRLISVFSSGSEDIKGKKVNKSSYYDLSPNFLQITQDKLLSLNINFDDSYSEEKKFDYNSIVKNRVKHEQNIKPYTPKKNIELLSNLEPKEHLQIIDMYDTTNIKHIPIDKTTQFIFTHNELEQFYGIDKDTKIEIDTKNKTIKNLSTFEIKIGYCGSVLKQGESIKMADRMILLKENGFSLGVVIKC